MCVIIQKPAGIKLPEEDYRTAYEKNSCGFGYAYYDPATKRINSFKEAGISADKMIELVNKLTPYNAVIHYRIRTHGGKETVQCHPFRILNQEYDGQDMFFAHNGVIQITSENTIDSDTMAFNDQILRPMLKKDPSLIKEKSFHQLIERYIGNGSKLCFLYGEGEFLIINEKAGGQRNGCWVSNDHSFQKPYVHTPHNSNVVSYNRSTHSGRQAFTTTLLDEPVSEGDEVIVVNSQDLNWVGSGKICNTTIASIGVKMQNTKGAHVTMYFNAKNGESFMENGAYNIMPAYSPSDQKKSQKSHKEAAERTQKTAEQGNVTPCTSVSPLTDGATGDTNSNTPLIKKGGFVFNSTEVRYGGENITPDHSYFVSDDLSEELTLEELNDLTDEDLFSLIDENPVFGFAVLKDLLENFSMTSYFSEEVNGKTTPEDYENQEDFHDHFPDFLKAGNP